MVSWALLWVSCSGNGDADVGVCGDANLTRTVVFSELMFTRSEGGVSAGFDLDGRVSDGSATEDCGITDLTGPDGEPGIDNTWANILPALELTEAAAIEGLIQDAINSGEVLMTLELVAIDDDVSDACVDVRLSRAAGQPFLGTDDRVLPGQTFDPAPGREPVVVKAQRLEDGVLVAQGFDMLLPLSVFGKSFEFTLEDASIEVILDENGAAHGQLAGGLSVAYALEVASTDDVDVALVGIMEQLLNANADLGWDPALGECTQVSLGFTWTGVSSFWYADPG